VTSVAAATLARAGITPVRKRLWLDLDGLLTSADPTGRLYSHDKIEGIALVDGGRRVVLTNDSDFGIMPTTPPSLGIVPKMMAPSHDADFGEFMVVDLDKLKASADDRSALGMAMLRSRR
jgi:hypothetical protein